MSAVWLVARAQLRQRWRSGLIVVLLIAVVGTAVLAALAGARRTRSAPDRLLEATAAPDVFAGIPTDEAGRVDPGQLAQVGRLPGVEAVAPLAHLFMVPDGLELPPGRELDFGGSAGVDERFGHDVLRPRMVEGRRARLERPDEIVLNEDTAEALNVGSGDTVSFVSYTRDQGLAAEAGTDPGPPAGPTIDLVVAGIGRSPSDLGSGENFDNFPVLLTPAFYERYRTEIAASEGILLITLQGGADAIAFARAFEATFGTEEAFVSAANNGEELGPSLSRAIDTEVAALLIFAGVVALAGVVAIGQVLARQAAAAADDDASLRAVGLTPVTRLGVGALGALPVAVVGAVLAVAGAVAASTLLPFGLAGEAEPDRGVDVDRLVLALGGALLVAVVIALATAAGWQASRRSRRALTRSGLGSSFVVRRLARTGASPVATAGVRMALETGGGRNAVPVRPALAGAVLGVTGIVAALVIGASLDRLVESPSRYGWNWDVAVAAAPNAQGPEQLATELASHPGVGGAGTVESGSVRVAGRRIPANGFGGSIEPTVVDGRAPRADDEIALGADTLDRVDASIGDAVAVGRSGEEQHLRIVGLVVLPAFDTDEPADGVAVAGRLERLGESSRVERADVVAHLAPGADGDAVVGGLERDGFSMVATRRPVDVDTLAEMKSLPWLLAGVLAFVAGLALTHALVMTIRRRRRDIATLEAFGFVSGQVRATLAWQATTIAVVGLCVGIPLGLVAGRWIWAVMVRAIGMADDPVRPAVATVVVAAATIVVANLIAALPARAATRVRPATALRSE
jgi:ABC-type lipoprotein release transport system permease subunit